VKYFDWHNWGIKTRMLAITALPMTVAFTVILSTHVIRQREVEQDLLERGSLITSTVAQTSQHALQSGKAGYLEHALRGLLGADRSVHRIRILDAARRSVLEVSSEGEDADEEQQFSTSIHAMPPALNGQPEAAADAVLGYVEVRMSPSQSLSTRRTRTLICTTVAGMLTLVTGLVAFVLGRGLTKPLAATVDAVRRIRGGDYRHGLAVTSGGEIADLQRSIIDMTHSLAEFRNDLEARVEQRTREVAAARDAALKSDADRRRLIHKLNTAVEDERHHIAMDIHDHMNAAVIVVRLELQQMRALAQRIGSGLRADGSDTEALERVARLAALCESSTEHLASLYAKARDLVRRLRPEVLDALGIRDAIDDMLKQYQQVHPSCRFQFFAEGDLSSLPEQTAITCYRLVQEALSNSVKHSGAMLANVHMSVDGKPRTLRVEISDNGHGFDPSRIESGFGLLGMRERVSGANGVLDIQSAPGAGTRIIAVFELPANEIRRARS
jgi:two-component system sensor histidine kinase UhpB